jgi:hypothetical protein
MGVYALAGLAGVCVIIFVIVIPAWGNYERFHSVQQLEPQLKLVPSGATFVNKSYLAQPLALTTAVSIDYQYHLASDSYPALHAYYDDQLLRRGWAPDGASSNTSNPPSPDFPDIGLGYKQAGQHHDQLQYSVDYYDATQTLNLKIRSVTAGNN